MSDVNRLLHLVSTNLGIPRVKFTRILRALVGDDERIRAYTAAFKVKQIKLREQPLALSPLVKSMYNATIDTGSLIDIKKLLETVKTRGLLSSDDITVTECAFKYGRFQTAVIFSGKYAMAGDPSKPIISANFKAVDKNGAGISFDFHKSGKVRFSGAFDPEKVRDFFSQYRQINGPIKMNNRVVSFRIIGWKPKSELIHDAFSDPSIPGRFENIDISTKFMAKTVKKKTVKLPPSFLYITFGDKFDVILANTGTVQIQGTNHYKTAYKLLRKFFTELKNNDMLKKTRVVAVVARAKKNV